MLYLDLASIEVYYHSTHHHSGTPLFLHHPGESHYHRCTLLLIADHTSGDGHCSCKSSVCTVSDCISWSQVSQWTSCTKSHAENCISMSNAPKIMLIIHPQYLLLNHWFGLYVNYLSNCTLYTINLLYSNASCLLNFFSTNFIAYTHICSCWCLYQF